MSLRQSYRKKGYVIVPGVISETEVAEFRERFDELFKLESEDTMLMPSDIMKYPDVYGLAFRPRAVAALKEVLGDPYTIFADFQLHQNMFSRPGWHIDAGSEGRKPYFFSRQYRFVKCGISFQKNSSEWGGGIDIVSGGHRFPVVTPNVNLNYEIKEYYNRWGMRLWPEILRAGPGALVFFDSKLPHRPTWPESLKNPEYINQNRIANMPHDRTKYVFYWNSCSTNCAADFLKNSEIRAKHEFRHYMRVRPYFTDYMGRYFPDDYPDEFVNIVTNNNIQVAGPGKDFCSAMKQEHIPVT